MTTKSILSLYDNLFCLHTYDCFFKRVHHSKTFYFEITSIVNQSVLTQKIITATAAPSILRTCEQKHCDRRTSVVRHFWVLLNKCPKFFKKNRFNYFIDNIDFFQLPVNLLRAGRIFTFEPPPGVKANLIRTFNTIPASRMMKAPNERARLYLLLAWFHAIVQERLRYCPLGKLFNGFCFTRYFVFANFKK